ncbi:hypothetical protein [Actinospica robiniae]|uniref:hypothetical protein n=1 Tax=Actinospica robiniae TaxID=304901 RepID=UPI0004057A7D|nr:hypothetical protein [Actinospica robiniae]
MNKISTLPIAVYLYVQNMRTRAAERLEAQDRERGSTTVETAVIIAAIVVIAVSVITIIGKKVVDKANSISF